VLLARENSTPQATPATRQTAGSYESPEKPNLLNLPAEIRLQIYTELLHTANMKTRYRIESRYAAMVSGRRSYRNSGSGCYCGGRGPDRWPTGACELCRDQYLQTRRPWFVNAEHAEGLGPWRRTQHMIPPTRVADEFLLIERRSRRRDLMVFMQDDPSSRAIMQTCKKLYSELLGQYAKLHRDIVYLLGPKDCWYNVKDLIQQQSPTFRAQIRHLTLQGLGGLLGELEQYEELRPSELSRNTIFNSSKFPNLMSLTVDLREDAYHWGTNDQHVDIHNLWQLFCYGQTYIDSQLRFLRDLRSHRMPSVRLFYRFSIPEEHTRRHRNNLEERRSWTKVRCTALAVFS